jgi:hypothetical protein
MVQGSRGTLQGWEASMNMAVSAQGCGAQRSAPVLNMDSACVFRICASSPPRSFMMRSTYGSCATAHTHMRASVSDRLSRTRTPP